MQAVPRQARSQPVRCSAYDMGKSKEVMVERVRVVGRSRW